MVFSEISVTVIITYSWIKNKVSLCERIWCLHDIRGNQSKQVKRAEISDWIKSCIHVLKCRSRWTSYKGRKIVSDKKARLFLDQNWFYLSQIEFDKTSQDNLFKKNIESRSWSKDNLKLSLLSFDVLSQIVLGGNIGSVTLSIIVQVFPYYPSSSAAFLRF